MDYGTITKTDSLFFRFPPCLGQAKCYSEFSGLQKHSLREISDILREFLETMDEQRQLTELLDLAERLGVEVRQVPLDGQGGGICLLRGNLVLFVDTNAVIGDQIAKTAAAMGAIEGIEDSYVLPEVRELLERYCGN